MTTADADTRAALATLEVIEAGGLEGVERDPACIRLVHDVLEETDRHEVVELVGRVAEDAIDRGKEWGELCRAAGRRLVREVACQLGDAV